MQELSSQKLLRQSHVKHFSQSKCSRPAQLHDIAAAIPPQLLPLKTSRRTIVFFYCEVVQAQRCAEIVFCVSSYQFLPSQMVGAGLKTKLFFGSQLKMIS